VQRRPNKERKKYMRKSNMLTATLVALAFAITPLGQASPDEGPVDPRTAPTPRERPTPAPRPVAAANEGISADSEASSANSVSPADVQMPIVYINSIDNVPRGKTGAFVLDMKPALMLGGMYVKFSVSGTAIEGFDYVALVSPAYVGKSGFGLIGVQTLPDRRGS